MKLSASRKMECANFPASDFDPRMSEYRRIDYAEAPPARSTGTRPRDNHFECCDFIHGGHDDQTGTHDDSLSRICIRGQRTGSGFHLSQHGRLDGMYERKHYGW